MDYLEDAVVQVAVVFEDYVLPRLPPVFTTIYGFCPSSSTFFMFVRGVSSLLSGIPFAPMLVTLLACYVAFFTVYNSIRSAFRFTSTMAKYGTLLGLGYSAYNWAGNNIFGNGNGVGQANAGAGRRGQDFWANLPNGQPDNANGNIVNDLFSYFLKPNGNPTAQRTTRQSTRNKRAAETKANRERRQSRERESRHQETAHDAKSNMEQAAGWLLGRTFGNTGGGSVAEQLKKAYDKIMEEGR